MFIAQRDKKMILGIACDRIKNSHSENAGTAVCYSFPKNDRQKSCSPNPETSRLQVKKW
jgi:hypothetical protein